MAAPLETILLVDDEDTVRRFAHRALVTHGYRVLTASDGADALQVADQCADAIQLLLTDVIMPGMNGRELAELLLARQPHLRVLFISGYAENVLNHESAILPGAAFLGKPFKAKSLVTKVRDVLDAPTRPPLASDPTFA